MMATATASLPPPSFATGSAVVNTHRQVGLAIGVAVLIAALGDGGNPTLPLPAFRHGWDAIVIAGACRRRRQRRTASSTAARSERKTGRKRVPLC